MLLFGESKPLGERGLRWLKIHLANLYGFDKSTFDERVSFVDRHLDDIYDSADKPLEVSLSLNIEFRLLSLRTTYRDACGGQRQMTHGSALQRALS